MDEGQERGRKGPALHQRWKRPTIPSKGMEKWVELKKIDPNREDVRLTEA
jgi:hypothetical protein